jgi:DNA-binding NarL/FixJ family response regulator
MTLKPTEKKTEEVLPEPHEPIKTVVVEDDAAVRAILCEWIRQADGFRCVDDFADAEAALAVLTGDPPDVVLVDINLPGMNGVECVRRLKLRLRATQFVMLTVYEDADHIFDALAAGATGYLLKRTRREELITALREVHAGGSPMSSNIARKIVQSFQRNSRKPNQAEGLSPRENEVLALLARGYLYKEVADMIGISLPTVKTYIRRICEKLHVHSRAEAVALYVNLPRRGDP